jgi:hypothetical protein
MRRTIVGETRQEDSNFFGKAGTENPSFPAYFYAITIRYWVRKSLWRQDYLEITANYYLFAGSLRSITYAIRS